MSVVSKRVEALSLADLQNLIHRQARETGELEFKGTLPSGLRPGSRRRIGAFRPAELCASLAAALILHRGPGSNRRASLGRGTVLVATASARRPGASLLRLFSRARDVDAPAVPDPPLLCRRQLAVSDPWLNCSPVRPFWFFHPHSLALECSA